MGWGDGEEKSFAQVKKNLCSVLLFLNLLESILFLKENILFMGHFRRTVFLFFYTLR